jgi:hypothetical protein
MQVDSSPNKKNEVCIIYLGKNPRRKITEVKTINETEAMGETPIQ